jgi:quinol monooxygenase YgiN
MNDNIYWVFEVAINPGRLEDFKSLVSSMVEATQKNEAGTLNYEYAMSEDQQICHFYERYQDSNAL